MKLVCTQHDLNTHLSLVSRAVPSRPTHPVLANVKLEADEETQQVSLTAFDLNIGIRTSFAAEVTAGGVFTLPAKLLNDIIARLPDGQITLDDEVGETVATITSISGRYQVRGMGAEEFPELPVVQEGEAVELSAEALLEGLRGSLFATSSDETKQVLTGVHLKVQQHGLEFAATDGHRLAVVETSNQPKNEEEEAAENPVEFEVTIPARAWRELEKIVGINQASAGAVRLQSDRGQIVFELGAQRLTSRALDGQYPEYHKLIPKQFKQQVNVDRKALQGSLERISVLADQKNNIVKFHLDSENQELALSVDAQDVGSGRESLSAQISGDSIEIAFNVKYFMDGLKALQSSEIQIKLNTDASPVILTPLSGLKMTYLVMPVQVRA